MSLVTEKLFVKALRSSADLMDALGGRIFNTVDDEIDPDSASVPSIFVVNRGTTNQTATKDDLMESDTDTDTIELGISARSRNELARIASLTREVVLQYVTGIDAETEAELGFSLIDYTFQASGVSFDILKPCYFQALTYVCETENR